MSTARRCGCGGWVVDCPVARSNKKVAMDAREDGTLLESSQVGTYQTAWLEIAPDPKDNQTAVVFVGANRDPELPMLRLHRCPTREKR